MLMQQDMGFIFVKDLVLSQEDNLEQKSTSGEVRVAEEQSRALGWEVWM